MSLFLCFVCAQFPFVFSQFRLTHSWYRRAVMCGSGKRGVVTVSVHACRFRTRGALLVRGILVAVVRVLLQNPESESSEKRVKSQRVGQGGRWEVGDAKY